LGESCNVTTTFKKVFCVRMYTFGCRAHHSRHFIQRYLYVLAPICEGYAKWVIHAI